VAADVEAVAAILFGARDPADDRRFLEGSSTAARAGALGIMSGGNSAGEAEW